MELHLHIVYNSYYIGENIMKEFLKKLTKIQLNFILIIITILTFGISEKILNIFNISFRNWFSMVITVVIFIWIFLSIIICYKSNKKSRSILNRVLIIFWIIIGICCVFWKYTLLFGALLFSISNFNINEHVVDFDNGKKVVYVKSVWMSTDVQIHDYYGPLFCSYKYDSEHYKGLYDKYDKDYIESQKRYEEEKKNNRENNYNNQTNPYNTENSVKIPIKAEITEGDEILYKEKFDDTVVAVVCKGDWSGKHIVQIMKSKDDENTWTSMLDKGDGAIDLHYGTKFKFYNENFGYYLDSGLQGDSMRNFEFKFTDDGGKSFNRVKFDITDTEIGDKEFEVVDLPIFENGQYIIKLNVYFGNDEREYTLYSINGIAFELSDT